ncbi:MAG: hypothetical protein K2Y51_25870 [Gammaproteobacteria bacterium]|jgi:hypothetical protein|nr:hypothetical protein [Gammaproteobacteria bacterium]
MKNLLLAAGLLASALSLPATATTLVPLADDGAWSTFDVDALTSLSGGLEWIDLDGVDLAFSLTLSQDSVLRVVDLGFRGDRFELTVSDGITTQVLGQTSAVANPDIASEDIVIDPDLAWADTNYSKGSFLLGAGSWTVTGVLIQSADFGGAPLNATLGAVSLTAVPVPATGLLMLGASGILGLFTRRRA